MALPGQVQVSLVFPSERLSTTPYRIESFVKHLSADIGADRELLCKRREQAHHESAAQAGPLLSYS